MGKINALMNVTKINITHNLAELARSGTAKDVSLIKSFIKEQGIASKLEIGTNTVAEDTVGSVEYQSLLSKLKSVEDYTKILLHMGGL